MNIIHKAIVTEGKSNLAEFINEKTGRVCHGTYFHVVAEHRCDEIDCDCLTQEKFSIPRCGTNKHFNVKSDFHLPKKMGKEAVIDFLNNCEGVATEDITWTKQN